MSGTVEQILLNRWTGNLIPLIPNVRGGLVFMVNSAMYILQNFLSIYLEVHVLSHGHSIQGIPEIHNPKICNSWAFIIPFQAIIW